MPFTVQQLNFLGVHLGLAVAPEFIENRRCAEQFKELRAKFDQDYPDLASHHQGRAIATALLECDELAKTGTRFAQALKLLEQAQALAQMPPPPVEPPPAQPQPAVAPSPELVAEQPPNQEAPVAQHAQPAQADQPDQPVPPAPPVQPDPPAQPIPADQPPPPPIDQPAQPAPVDQVPPAPADQAPPAQAAPAPALPTNLVDAVKVISQTAAAAQETIRAGNGELMALQNRFIDLQTSRQEKPPGIEFDALTAQMTQLVEDIKKVIASQDQALAQITAEQQQLAGLAVNAPDVPPTAAALHQKATAELADRQRKAQTICAESAKMRDYAIQALADGSFTAKAGVKVYEPGLFELPSIIR